MPKMAVPDTLQEMAQRYKEATENKVTNIDPWCNSFLLTKDGGMKASSSYNVELILANDRKIKDWLKYDEFADKIVKPKQSNVLNSKAGSLEDADLSELKSYIEKEYRYSPTTNALTDGTVVYARHHGYNPVKNRIESVTWDGTKRVPTFFADYLGTENNEYTRAVTTAWLTGAVARVYQPGVKFEVMPILHGGQGIGKSTLVGAVASPSNLSPDEDSHFLDGLQSMGKQKDDFQQLQGSWIVEIGEMSAMKKTDVELTKQFISTSKDHYRDSYGRIASDHPRKCVFVGTSNPSEFLKDKTGNRRFFPIECNVQEKKKDPLNINDADILQVLAEAKALYDQGEKIFITDDIQALAEGYQKEAMITDPTEEQILSYIDMPVPRNWNNYSLEDRTDYFTNYQDNGQLKDKTGKLLNEFEVMQMEEVTTREILQVAFNIDSKDLISSSRGNAGRTVSMTMENQDNWKHKRIRDKTGKQTRGYKRIKKCDV